MIKVIFND